MNLLPRFAHRPHTERGGVAEFTRGADELVATLDANWLMEGTTPRVKRRNEISRALSAALLAFLAPLAVGGAVSAFTAMAAVIRIGSAAWLTLGLAGAATVLLLNEGSSPRGRFTGFFGSIARVYLAYALACWLALAVASAHGVQAFPRSLVLTWLLTAPVFVASRRLLESVVRFERERVAVIGSGVVATQVARLARRHPEAHVHIVGRFDDNSETSNDEEPLWLGTLEDIPAVVGHLGIDRVVVAYSSTSDRDLADHLRPLAHSRVQIDVVPRFFELVGPSVRARSLGSIGLMSMPSNAGSIAGPAVKRGIDLVLATLGLAAISLPMIVVATFIKLSDRGPVFYRQQRVGRGGEIFGMIKFRTMVVNADQVMERRLQELQEQGHSRADAIDMLKDADDPRITGIGRFLRGSSIDELPQLLNVLKGDMSIVGPRPLPLYEAPAVHGWQHQRHAVRPGITGLWQVLGRSDTPWDERMALDCLYVQRSGPIEDLRIILRTIRTVVAADGAR